MIKRLAILYGIGLWITALGYGQQPVTPIGNVKTVSVAKQQVNIKTDNGEVQVSVYGPSVVRIRMDRKKPGKDFSYAVIGRQEETRVDIQQGSTSIMIQTDSLKAVIRKKPYSIAFFTLDGQTINEDENGLTTSWVNASVTTYKKMQDGERFVGLGEKTGNLDRRGDGYTNWNSDVFGYRTGQDPLYSTIPFYIGIHHHLNYGIFLDNTYQSDFNFGASNDRYSSFGARGGEMNYYFIYHTAVKDIIKDYTALTGRMPLPPLWSLGYQQNRYSYYPETEVLRIAQTLREKKIPADGITLDIHYMDRYQLFTWDKSRFPDPPAMIAKLKSMGLRTTVIVDPGIKVEKGAPPFERGLQQDVYLKYPDGQYYSGQVWPGWCYFTDFTSEKGRAFWRNEVKFFADNGVSGIWNDMNEIATWGQKMPDNVLFDYDGNTTTHLQAHNVYALEMARSSYEGAKTSLGERPFVLTRAGYAGLQRYSAIWTGDNRSEEDHMLLGVRLLNSLGLSGVPFTGMDIGGFTGNPSISLFTRWMQLGAFCPYYRNHTAVNTKSSEPWTYGEEALEISRNFINLRYKLMPYLYSTFYEASVSGMPIVRSLAIENTYDPKIYDPAFQNQFQFGKALLVVPFESTKDFGKIYLPEGNWYDLYNDTPLKGNEEKIIPLTNAKLPVFVKGGSIIPMQSLVQSTAEAPSDTLTIHVYNGTDTGSFVYYEDDGKSFQYQNGNYFRQTITLDPTARKISFAKAEGNFSTHFKQAAIVFHGFERNGNSGQPYLYSFLDPISLFDPQLNGGAKDGCPVFSTVVPFGGTGSEVRF